MQYKYCILFIYLFELLPSKTLTIHKQQRLWTSAAQANGQVDNNGKTRTPSLYNTQFSFAISFQDPSSSYQKLVKLTCQCWLTASMFVSLNHHPRTSVTGFSTVSTLPWEHLCLSNDRK